MLSINAQIQDPSTIASLMAMLARDLGPAPTLQAFENAAQAAYDPAQASSFGLKPLLDAQGAAITETLASGMTASAFVDATGNVIIAYQGTTTGAQEQLDVAILSGTDPSRLQGFADALDFAKKVETVAAGEGIDQTHVYVTGHSLGGTLAAYVASQTGLGGASFAGSGVPGYQAPSTPAANFVSYVEKGDPFANYATDSAEKASAVVSNPHMDHYGTVVSLGSSADAVELGAFATKIAGYSIGAALTGATTIGATQLASLEQQFDVLMGEHHALSTYDADAATAIIPATAYGLQDTSMTRFMASVATDAKHLLADLPRIFGASSTASALAIVAADFPDLAKEVTSMMHATGFQTAMATLATVEPAVYGAITSVRGMTALIDASNHHLVGVSPLHLSS